MSKWISDAYIKRLLRNNRLLQGNCEYKLWEQEVEKNVDAMPHIDIVRCKECKWWVVAMDENNTDEDYLKCNMDKWTDADDFCSYGERREP